MSTGPMISMFDTMDLLRGQRNKTFEDQRRRKKAADDDEDRAFTEDERARGLETRQMLEDAAAPVAVEEGVYQPSVDDDGNAMPANPAQHRVGGQHFGDRAAADKAAAAHNAPEAVTQRMSSVLTRRANPEGAQKLRTGQMAEKTAALKLSDAEREEALEAYRTDLRAKVPMGDWKALSDFASNSKLDGADGAVKYEWRPSQDGAAYELFVKGGDLPWAPTGTKAANTPEGFAEQLMHLERLPIDKVLLHLDRKQTRADAKAYREELLKDKDEAAAQRKVEFEARMTDLREARAARAAGRGGAGQAGGVEGDGETVDLSAIDKEIEGQLGGKDAAGNPIKPDLRARQVIRALAARSPEAVSGDPRGAAISAMRMYDDALKRSGGNHDQAMQRIAVAIDMAKTATPGAMVQLGGGKPEAVGAVAPAALGAPAAAGARPAASVAMQQLAEQERARREARQAQEAERRAAVDGQVTQANQLTLEQIRAMDPDQAFALLNSAGGRALPSQVREVLRAQSRGARLNTGRGLGAKL